MPNNNYDEIVSKLLLNIPKNYINIDLAIKFFLSIDHYNHLSENLVSIEMINQNKNKVKNVYHRISSVYNNVKIPSYVLSDDTNGVIIFDMLLTYIKKDGVDTDGEEKLFNQLEIYQQMLLDGTILKRALEDGYIIEMQQS